MGKISYLQIELSKAVYMAGEMVTGSVSLGVVERIKINCVKFEMHGEAHVHWSEKLTGAKKKHAIGPSVRGDRRHYKARETYVDLSLFFVNQQNSGDNYLEVGEYKYPFQLALPPALPSSLEVNHGYVRYWTTARVDIPWAIDKYARMAFTVINMMDLNTMPPAIRMPVAMSNNTQVGCCSKGMIEYSMSIPKAGYVPGEGIPFTVSIDNKSEHKCTNVKVKLTKHQTLIAQMNHKKRNTTEVGQVLMPRPEVPENTSDKWQGILVVPAVVSSIPHGMCKVIEIDYILSLAFNTGTLGMTYAVDIPITIGYIPLRNDANASSVTAYVFQPSTFNPESKLDDEETGDSLQSNQKTFQPVYPFYQGLNSSAAKP